MTSALPLRLGKILLAAGLSAGAAWWFTQYNSSPISAASSKPAPPLAHSVTSPFAALSADTSDADLLRLARFQVARSAQQALAFAQSADPSVRARLQHAILQAWGELDLPSATAWALSNETDPRADLRAALAGAMRDPASAIQFGQQLLADNSPYSGTFGDALIDALGSAGEFQAAVQFAAAAPADRQEDWLSAGFRNWAQSQPTQALQALDSIADPDLRDSVFRAVAQGWSGAEPATLAAYANALPDDQRDYALNQSMFKWSQQDPVALATWLVNVPPGPNYDNGAFFLLTENNAASLAPTTAMSWVQSIGDPALQRSSFDRVLQQWTQTDPSAARNYVENASWLQSDDRANILQNF